MPVDRQMLGVTLLTAGLVIAFIMGSKEPEKVEEPMGLIMQQTQLAYDMIRWIETSAEKCINQRKEWIALFESNDTVLLSSQMLKEHDPEKYKRFRKFIKDVMGLADEFQKLSYRLTNEQDEAEWVRSNGQLLSVPTETIQLMNRYDKHVSETVVNNTHNKQLVMNVKQYPDVNRNTQHNIEGAQNMQMVDNGVRDLSSMDVEMGGDPHSTSKAVAMIGQTKTNPVARDEGVYLNQQNQQPFNAVQPGMSAVALKDHANPAIEANYGPNDVPRPYVDPKTMLRRAQNILMAPEPTEVNTTSSGYNRAKVTKQSTALPTNPYDKERERPQAPQVQSDGDVLRKAQELIKKTQQATQAIKASADSKLGESGEIPAKMPPLLTVQNESMDAGTLALPAPAPQTIQPGPVVPAPPMGVKRQIEDNPFVALTQPQSKQQKASPSPAYSPSRISEKTWRTLLGVSRM